MKKSDQASRRQFLKKLALGVGSSGLIATQSKLQLIQAAIAADSDYSALDDYKSLVCVFLFGGNDAFNMLVPYEQNSYNKYRSIRTSMALPRNTLLPLKNGEHAFHASMPGLQQLFNQDKLAISTNVGALIEPTTRSSYKNRSVQLPPDLFSHNHQQEFWETGRSSKNSILPPGWGGRMIDMLASANRNPSEPAMFSVLNSSLWQKGKKPLDFVLDTRGIKRMEAFAPKNWPLWKESRIKAWREIVSQSQTSDHLMQQFMGSRYQRTEERIEFLINAISNAPEIKTEFPSDNGLADQLKTVAKMISVRKNLGMKRQIFFVSLGGWDSHGNQLSDHTINLLRLNGALSSFYKATEELGVADSVTAFTASEFGRTMSINGDGTDHAWAGHNLVLGGAVNGGKIFGDAINFDLNGPDDAGDTGRYIPKHAVDQYGATLAKWMGMTNSDLLEVFPNLHNFNTHDLGFMS